jgi:hypothetical protein
MYGNVLTCSGQAGASTEEYNAVWMFLGSFLSSFWCALQAANSHDDVLRADNADITNVSGSKCYICHWLYRSGFSLVAVKAPCSVSSSCTGTDSSRKGRALQQSHSHNPAVGPANPFCLQSHLFAEQSQMLAVAPSKPFTREHPECHR